MFEAIRSKITVCVFWKQFLNIALSFKSFEIETVFEETVRGQLLSGIQTERQEFVNATSVHACIVAHSFALLVFGHQVSHHLHLNAQFCTSQMSFAYHVQLYILHEWPLVYLSRVKKLRVFIDV